MPIMWMSENISYLMKFCGYTEKIYVMHFALNFAITLNHYLFSDQPYKHNFSKAKNIISIKHF